MCDESVKLHPRDESDQGKLDDMITEYQIFHDSWIENLKKLRDKNANTSKPIISAGNRGRTLSSDTNGTEVAV